LDIQYIKSEIYKSIGHPIYPVIDRIQETPCCPPSCCDMRGYLSFTIMWILRKKEMYGQELAEELERMRGTKPNSGTLYPALKELERKGMVETRKEGRKKIYRLTEAGHVGAMEACEYFFTVYEGMYKEYSEMKAEQAAPVS
jgi:PadR family transcriptional regulator PadR